MVHKIKTDENLFTFIFILVFLVEKKEDFKYHFPLTNSENFFTLPSGDFNLNLINVHAIWPVHGILNFYVNSDLLVHR